MWHDFKNKILKRQPTQWIYLFQMKFLASHTILLWKFDTLTHWSQGDVALISKEQFSNFPNSKVHGGNIGPTWVLSAPDGPHVGPMVLAIRFISQIDILNTSLEIALMCGCHITLLVIRHRFSLSLVARFLEPTWGPSGPKGPKWAPCWPYELC